LFRRSNAEEIDFSFQATARNQPLQRFFESSGIRESPDGRYRITRAAYLSQCGELPHRVLEPA
jgi:hypothetical protein